MLRTAVPPRVLLRYCLTCCLAVALLLMGTLGCSSESSETEQSQVDVRRTPEKGIQPVTRTDAKGTVHMIYFKGEPAAGDIYYVRKAPEDTVFTRPVRVNDQPRSAVATGTVRGAQMALGRDRRVHVAWMGSNESALRAPDGTAPMLYTHSVEQGQQFVPARNVVQYAAGLDGGGTVAADRRGKVYVLWHAGAGAESETDRRVWVAQSDDGGETFTREVPVSPDSLGACGCCGMASAVGASGQLYTLFRAARRLDQRDMYLIVGSDTPMPGNTRLLEKWPVDACPMSTSDTDVNGDQVTIAWENQQQVAYAVLEPERIHDAPIVHAPGSGSNRKHPAIAVNKKGQVLLAWTENTNWATGGTVHWQLYEADGRPADVHGQADNLPAWSRPSVYTDGDDNFVVVY